MTDQPMRIFVIVWSWNVAGTEPNYLEPPLALLTTFFFFFFYPPLDVSQCCCDRDHQVNPVVCTETCTNQSLIAPEAWKGDFLDLH